MEVERRKGREKKDKYMEDEHMKHEYKDRHKRHEYKDRHKRHEYKDRHKRHEYKDRHRRDEGKDSNRLRSRSREKKRSRDLVDSVDGERDGIIRGDALDVEDVESNPNNARPIIESIESREREAPRANIDPVDRETIDPENIDPEALVPQDPITQDPITQDPISQDPITQDPITQDPISQDLISQDPITQDPITQDPITQDPITEDPITEDPITLVPQAPTRIGGIYMPPFKQREIESAMLKKEEKFGKEHQRYMWEILRKSINGIINKVNVSNIQNIILELFNENLLRGKGLLIRGIMRAQMASPNFTHVYAALLAVINTKLPNHGLLLIHRVLHAFRRAYKRNNKIVCMATTRMLAHLINQQVIHELIALELLSLLLQNPTEDSVEIAVDFMQESGQVLADITPAGVNAIFERFRGILQEGHIDKRVQYLIEGLFAVRKNKFNDHVGVIPELDLVEDQDRITHEIPLDHTLNTEEGYNVFKYDMNYEKNELEWIEIKKEVLGEEEERMNKKQQAEEDSEAEEVEEDKNEQIIDYTEQDLINLRRTIYLVIMSSVNFEECAHKLLKLNIREGQEMELCNMIIECCMQERTYLRFYGLLAQRFCVLNELYQLKFQECFYNQYLSIHRLDTNKLRNLARFFGHLLYSDAIEWRVVECIELTEEKTTSSSRIFIKIVFQELSEQMGLNKLNERLNEETLQEFFVGLFPKDNLRNTRFSINFFTSIGLGALTDQMRTFLKNAPKLLMEQKLAALRAQVDQLSSSSSDSSSSSGSGEEDEDEHHSSHDDSQSDSDSDSDTSREYSSDTD